MSKTTKKQNLLAKHHTLHLSFDINQITKSLQYEFTSKLKDGSHKEVGSPFQSSGTLAGTCLFNMGDDLSIVITAKRTLLTSTKPSEPAASLSIKVKDFTILCVSTLGPDRWCDLSLFAKRKASKRVKQWRKSKNPNPDEAHIEILEPIPITAEDGQWEMSGFLSIEIKNGKKKSVTRLLYFDPEGSAGSGAGFGGSGP